MTCRIIDTMASSAAFDPDQIPALQRARQSSAQRVAENGTDIDPPWL